MGSAPVAWPTCCSVTRKRSSTTRIRRGDSPARSDSGTCRSSEGRPRRWAVRPSARWKTYVPRSKGRDGREAARATPRADSQPEGALQVADHALASAAARRAGALGSLEHVQGTPADAGGEHRRSRSGRDLRPRALRPPPPQPSLNEVHGAPMPQAPPPQMAAPEVGSSGVRLARDNHPLRRRFYGHDPGVQGEPVLAGDLHEEQPSVGHPCRGLRRQHGKRRSQRRPSPRTARRRSRMRWWPTESTAAGSRPRAWARTTRWRPTTALRTAHTTGAPRSRWCTDQALPARLPPGNPRETSRMIARESRSSWTSRATSPVVSSTRCSTSSGRPRAGCGLLVRTLASLPEADIARRQRAAERAMLHMGITFSVYGHDAGTEKILPFDLVPQGRARGRVDDDLEGARAARPRAEPLHRRHLPRASRRDRRRRPARDHRERVVVPAWVPRARSAPGRLGAHHRDGPRSPLATGSTTSSRTTCGARRASRTCSTIARS